MIAITGLTRLNATTTELAGIDLSIAHGECVAVAGPTNGGRHALMRILATLVRPSAGHVVIAGLDAVSDVDRVRQLIAYAGSVPICANRLRVIEHLRLVAGARRQASSAADSAADLVGLRADAPIETLSERGRDRLTLAAALASGANVLLLDDAFRALDAPERARVSDWLVAARERGTTVIVAADDDDVPAWSDRIVGLQAGRIVDSPARTALGRAAGAPQLVSA